MTTNWLTNEWLQKWLTTKQIDWLLNSTIDYKLHNLMTDYTTNDWLHNLWLTIDYKLIDYSTIDYTT
jgi:hypothetical protein